MTSRSFRKNTGWYVAAAIIIIVIVIAGILIYRYSQSAPNPNPSATPAPTSTTGTPVPPASNVEISIFAGELSPSQYGFGNTSSVTSPGPSFTVKVGSTVTVHFGNAGSMGHNWALVTQKTDASSQLAFASAQVQSGLNPVAPAGTGTATFVADQAGTYYYICQVPGHVTLGMWGYFTVIP
jgi:uncharacterized cupredoxin-like copper-binding protein